MKKTLDLRKWLFGFLMLVLLLPMLNHVFFFIESAPLKGDVHLAPDTVFTPDAWLRGAYQAQKESYLNDHTGFQTDFVRINNQLDYLAFGKLHARNVMMGKQQYLFESGYQDAYFGADFEGDSLIRERLLKLRYIQDTLSRAGKQLVLAFAPSKSSFYPEYLPNLHPQPRPDGKTNYSVIKKMCGELGIQNIDLNGWYRSIKTKYPNRLFSKQGIHWTLYGADLAADTFNRYLGRLLHKQIPTVTTTGTTCGQPPKGSDNDISAALNLIWPYTKEEFCYNNLSFNEDSATTQKPDVIFISDSFFWVFLNEGFPQHCYSRWQSWFYFGQAVVWRGPGTEITDQPLSAINWMDELKQTDAVVLLFTEPNLVDMGRGFIEQAYDQFHGITAGQKQ